MTLLPSTVSLFGYPDMKCKWIYTRKCLEAKPFMWVKIKHFFSLLLFLINLLSRLFTSAHITDIHFLPSIGKWKNFIKSNVSSSSSRRWKTLQHPTKFSNCTSIPILDFLFAVTQIPKMCFPTCYSVWNFYLQNKFIHQRHFPLNMQFLIYELFVNVLKTHFHNGASSVRY